MTTFPELVPYETILWEGAPDTGLRFGMEVMATGILAAAIILGCLGIATVVDRATPGVFWIILMPGLIFGALMVLAPALLDSGKRKRTAYRLTNKRAVICVGPDCDSHALPSVDAIQLRGTAPQTVTFGHDRRNRPISFERITDAAKVSALMRAAQKEAP